MDHNFWKPAPLLEKLATEGQFFGEAPEIEKRDKKLTFKQSKNMGGV